MPAFESGSENYRGFVIEFSVHEHEDGDWAGSYSLIKDGVVISSNSHPYNDGIMVLERSSTVTRQKTLEMARLEADAEASRPQSQAAT